MTTASSNGRRPADAPDGWLVEKLVDLGPTDRARFVEQLRAEDAALAARAEDFARALSGTSGDGLTSFLSRSAVEAAAGLSDRLPLAPGDVVGVYRVVREIGRGGMGVVYLAERDDLGLRAALKVLEGGVPRVASDPADLTASEDARRFHAERRHLAGLSHPGIPKIYDAGQTADGDPFYAMELVEGEPLDIYVHDRRPGLMECVGLFVQLCEAVRHVHDRGLAHGDLKPGNALVYDTDSPAGSRRTRPSLKLVDFGVADRIDAPSPCSPRGEHGAPLCLTPRPFTPAYASPEVRAGEPPSVRSDVYALGVVLREIVAELPGRHVPASRPDPAPLLDVADRATCPCSEDRYESLDALLLDLHSAARRVAWSAVPVVNAHAGTRHAPARRPSPNRNVSIPSSSLRGVLRAATLLGSFSLGACLALRHSR